MYVDVKQPNKQTNKKTAKIGKGTKDDDHDDNDDDDDDDDDDDHGTLTEILHCFSSTVESALASVF